MQRSMAMNHDRGRQPFRKLLDGSQDFIREQALISAHTVNRPDISGEGEGMIEQIVLAIFCLAGIGFMLYVLFNLQREIRRERRDRLGSRVHIDRRQNEAFTATPTDENAQSASPFNQYKTPTITRTERESPSIGFDLRPIRKSSSGGSR